MEEVAIKRHPPEGRGMIGVAVRRHPASVHTALTAAWLGRQVGDIGEIDGEGCKRIVLVCHCKVQTSVLSKIQTKNQATKQ